MLCAPCSTQSESLLTSAPPSSCCSSKRNRRGKEEKEKKRVYTESHSTFRPIPHLGRFSITSGHSRDRLALQIETVSSSFVSFSPYLLAQFCILVAVVVVVVVNVAAVVVGLFLPVFLSVSIVYLDYHRRQTPVTYESLHPGPLQAAINNSVLRGPRRGSSPFLTGPPALLLGRCAC